MKERIDGGAAYGSTQLGGTEKYRTTSTPKAGGPKRHGNRDEPGNLQKTLHCGRGKRKK